MHQILLATHNPGKLREMRQITAHLDDWEWISLDAFPNVPEAIEDGATLAANARAKALHYAEASGLATLADDSGLEVDALGGEPGVLSARYAGELKDDARNNRKLIEALRGVPREARTARFRCAMAFARPGEVLFETQGSVEGRIIDTPRGENGFGYDPHFWVDELDATTAELPADHKNTISHRGKALAAMLPRIIELLRIVAQD